MVITENVIVGEPFLTLSVFLSTLDLLETCLPEDIVLGNDNIVCFRFYSISMKFYFTSIVL